MEFTELPASAIRLSTPLTLSDNEGCVRITVGTYSWMPCVVRDEDLKRVRDWLNQAIINRACWDLSKSTK